MSRKWIIVSVATVISLGVIAFTANSIHQNNLAEARAEARAERALADFQAQLEAERIRNDVSWVPDGYFTGLKDKSLAWKWIRGADYDCYSCKYWTVQVISRDGCQDGVSGRLNIERNGVVVDSAYDSLSYLGAGQTGRLQFVHFREGSHQGSLIELECR